MYCEGNESGVKDWVATVQRLRYKDYQLAIKPAEKKTTGSVELHVPKGDYGKLEELQSVKDYGSRMERLGLWTWWRKGMGYVSED